VSPFGREEEADSTTRGVVKCKRDELMKALKRRLGNRLTGVGPTPSKAGEEVRGVRGEIKKKGSKYRTERE